MLENIGKRAVALAVALPLLLALVFGVAMAPMLVMMMRPTLQSLMLQSGVSTEFEMVNYPNVGGGTSAPMMSIQVSAMPPVTMSLIASLVISLALWPKRPARRSDRTKAALQQVVAIAVVSLVIALGMTCSILTPELLPAFWVDWVCPWVPQRTLGGGLRNAIFMGGGPFGTGLDRSLATVAVGVAVMAIATVLP